MEMVLSAFLQSLFQTLMSGAFQGFFKRRELNENILERLNTALLTVSVVLIDAEEKQITNPVVEKWINELRDVVYHAEDALDDIATEALRLNIGAESSTNRLKQLRGKMSLGDLFDGNPEHLEIRLERVTLRLERLALKRNILGLKELTAMTPKPRLPTTSLVDESEVFGRVDEKDEMVRFLIPENEEENGISVVAVVGIGKTTLSQLLYNDQRVLRHFETKAWVHVSEEFDVFKITKKVYESITSRPCEFTDLDVLQVKLKERLVGLRVLLVLDDLWNENFDDWDLLRRPFLSAPEGSRILVTTKICRLKSLQTLTTFFVSSGDGARISELGELHELHGKLTIFDLQRVLDVADAAGANLNSKKHLKEINFVWRSESNSSESNKNEAEVFEKLHPLRHIEKLTIERYNGRRFPEWLSDSSFSRVVCIRLSDCQNCSSLPSLGQLPGLKELYITRIAGMRSIGGEFYFSNQSLHDREQQPFRSLETLRFHNVPDWEDWLDIRVTKSSLFPSLKNLSVLKCPQLTGTLPTFLPSLISLHIQKCGILDFQPDLHENSYEKLQTLSIKSSCDSRHISFRPLP